MPKRHVGCERRPIPWRVCQRTPAAGGLRHRAAQALSSSHRHPCRRLPTKSRGRQRAGWPPVRPCRTAEHLARPPSAWGRHRPTKPGTPRGALVLAGGALQRPYRSSRKSLADFRCRLAPVRGGSLGLNPDESVQHGRPEVDCEPHRRMVTFSCPARSVTDLAAPDTMRRRPWWAFTSVFTNGVVHRRPRGDVHRRAVRANTSFHPPRRLNRTGMWMVSVAPRCSPSSCRRPHCRGFTDPHFQGKTA